MTNMYDYFDKNFYMYVHILFKNKITTNNLKQYVALSMFSTHDRFQFQ